MDIYTLLTFAFGSPRAAFAARVLGTMMRIAPCDGDAACEDLHQRSAIAITVAALEDEDPELAAGVLLGIGRHETGFRTEHQVHGPAVTVFQHEVPRAEREELLADPLLAARRALWLAKSDPTMLLYATGRRRGRDTRGTAAGLRSSIACARSVFSGRVMECPRKNESPKVSSSSTKGSPSSVKKTRGHVLPLKRVAR